MSGNRCRLRLVFRPLAPGEFDLEAALFAGSVGLGAGVLLWHATGLAWPHCWVRGLTGLVCPFCGATHAGLALLRGEVLRAVDINPLASAIYVVTGLYNLYAALSMGGGWRRLRLAGFDQQRKKVLLLTILFLVAVDWAYLLARAGP